MPSSTPNYGWTYPISSDDLNAGATTTGTLATGIDATVKAIDDAKAPKSSATLTNPTIIASGYTISTTELTHLDGLTQNVQTGLDARPISNKDNVEFYPSVTYTTNANGEISWPHAADQVIANGRQNPGFAPIWLVPDNLTYNVTKVWGIVAATGAVTRPLNTSITFSYLRCF